MTEICGLSCCNKCDIKKSCGGCSKNNGHPFGKNCIAAEYIRSKGIEFFTIFKNNLIKELNDLEIKNLHVDDLNFLNGFYVNLEYLLPNGSKIKLLNDHNVYLGNQIEIPNSTRCYGIVADDKFLLVCEYGCNGIDPEIIVYKKR